MRHDLFGVIKIDIYLLLRDKILNKVTFSLLDQLKLRYYPDPSSISPYLPSQSSDKDRDNLSTRYNLYSLPLFLCKRILNYYL